MAEEDDLLQDAIIDQINAELGAINVSMKAFARMLDRPYDSTRDYLKKERTMSLGFFLASATALDIPAGELIARARMRLPR